MLEEKIGYLKEYPLNIKIFHIKYYPFHVHDDTEALYVLKGTITLKCGSSIYDLQEGDVFIINDTEVHGIYNCSEDSIVMSIHINVQFFTKEFPYLPDTVYRTANKDRTNTDIVDLRLFILKIALNHYLRQEMFVSDNIALVKDLIRFMDINFSFFYFDGKTVMQRKSNKMDLDERLSKIIRHIYRHHNEKISLAELAEQNYISNYHISHLITEGIGLNFRELLGFARVEESERFLLGSNKKISSIAKDVGFSTTAYYEKYFRKWFGYSPKEYREMYKDRVKGACPELLMEITDERALHILTDSLNNVAKYAEYDDSVFKEAREKLYTN